VNQLVDVQEEIRRRPRLVHMSEAVHADERAAAAPTNEFSGPGYRIINFVADLPLRIERLVPSFEFGPDDSHVVFVLTEFQVADKATAVSNESGPQSHEAYKARQHERVRARLMRPAPDDE
jgi:uncharacterized protein (TIGR04552 family)